jgi:hypothetical protein
MSRGVRAARFLAVTFMVVAGLAYSGWALQVVLPAGELSPIHSHTSELTADGQPYQQLFRTTDLVASVAFLVMVPLLLRLVPAQTWPRLSVAAIGVFGVNLMIRAAFTLDCAPSASPACRERLLTGDFSGDQLVHLVTSAVTVVLYLTSSAFAGQWWTRGAWRNTARTGLGIVLATTAGMTVLELTADGRFVGILERLQHFTMAGLLVAGAFYLLSVARLRAL